MRDPHSFPMSFDMTSTGAAAPGDLPAVFELTSVMLQKMDGICGTRVLHLHAPGRVVLAFCLGNALKVHAACSGLQWCRPSWLVADPR